MNEYELLFIIKASVEEDDVQKILESVHSVITQQGGSIVNEDDWGVRRFAYEIRHEATGRYHFIVFRSAGTALAEIDKALRLISEILRHQTVMHVPSMSVNEDMLVQPEFRKKKVERDETRTAPRSTGKVAVPAGKASADETAENEPPVNLEELDKKLDKLLDEETVE